MLASKTHPKSSQNQSKICIWFEHRLSIEIWSILDLFWEPSPTQNGTKMEWKSIKNEWNMSMRLEANFKSLLRASRRARKTCLDKMNGKRVRHMGVSQYFLNVRHLWESVSAWSCYLYVFVSLCTCLHTDMCISIWNCWGAVPCMSLCLGACGYDCVHLDVCENLDLRADLRSLRSLRRSGSTSDLSA